jgi:hypothetical protein
MFLPITPRELWGHITSSGSQKAALKGLFRAEGSILIEAPQRPYRRMQ